MTPDLSEHREVLADQGLLPPGARCAFVTGSVARGWAHETSDIDLVVILAETFADERLDEIVVTVGTGRLPVTAFDHDGRRWEVRYWLDSLVDELLAGFSWPVFEAGRILGESLTSHEELFLGRLDSSRAFVGEEWLRDRRAELAASAFRSYQTSKALNNADSAVHAAVGQLGAGEVEGAVLSAREAFGWSVEALLASHGEFTTPAKWRPRRFRTVLPKALSYDRYWSIETMRDYDPQDPGAWVESVVTLCRDLSMDIEV